jgi:acetamidase/formamidase
VKVPGAGIYLGDMHAFQGDGEIAGHTADVAGTAVLEVHVIKGLKIDGPILFPVVDDLPYLARPFTSEELHAASAVAAKHGLVQIEADAPVTFIGTGPDLNKATANGLARAADVLGLSVDEVRNRATVAGAIEIGRNPGVVRVTFRAPISALDRAGLGSIPRGLYGV